MVGPGGIQDQHRFHANLGHAAGAAAIRPRMQQQQVGFVMHVHRYLTRRHRGPHVRQFDLGQADAQVTGTEELARRESHR